MTKLYANPYCCTLTGFYFDSLEEYQELLDEAKEKHNTDFEHSLEFIDGEYPELFSALDGEFPEWLEAYFELIEEDESMIDAVSFLLCNNGFSPADLDELKDKAEEVQMVDEDELEDYLLETLELPQGFNVNYIDVDAIKNDWECGGDLVKYGDKYVMNNNCL